jgi:hypothetical protein
MPTHDPYAAIYYKILIPLPRNNDLMHICTLQDFDEYDYAEDEWLKDDDGVVSFNSEEDAQRYLADHVDTKWIRPSDRLAKSHVNNWGIRHDTE